MARVVIYKTALREAGETAIVQPKFGGPTQPAKESTAQAAPPIDDYKDKLVKFVPAEVVAFFAPIASLVQDRPVLLIVAASVGLVATPAYLWTSARALDASLRPPMHNYVLSAVAFGAWALATSRLGSMAGMDSVATAFMLGLTVFLIPLLDSLIAGPARREGSQ